MTATTIRPAQQNDATWLRLVQAGIGLTAVGLVVFWAAGTFWTTVDGGDFEYTADYWYTATAVPMGIGAIVHVLGLRRLQRGRDGRLGTVGAWLFVVCCAVLAVECLASVLAGSELRWGPTYVLCSIATFVGLALLGAGSWRTGLVPRWMLGVWPPLWLFGSFFGAGPIPLVLVAFLILFGAVVTRRVELGRG